MYDKTIVIGRLGADPQLKGKYVEFTLSNSTIRDGVEEVAWHRIKAVGKQATLCIEHLHKGDLCCIEGHIERRNNRLTIIAERIVFLPARSH